MEIEYAEQDMLIELAAQHYWDEEVNEYTEKFTVPELMLEARELLIEHKDTVSKLELHRIRGILTYGIVNQHLSEKQRYVLGDFILTHS